MTFHRKIYGADVVELAAKYGTPLYVLFQEAIQDNFERYRSALEKVYGDHLICYAVKANTTFEVLRLLGELGAGADVASEFELQFALDSGISPDKIRANGNCKSNLYLEECIKRDIIINVDPEDELEIIDDLARELDRKAKINLRLSGFPLKHITSPAITTSSEWSKFGIGIQRANEVFRKVLSLKNVIPNGLMVHLGSQITDINAYHLVCGELLRLSQEADDLGFEVKEIDLGGGWGISYLGEEEWNEIKRKIADTKNANTTWANELIGYDEMQWASEELYCPFKPDIFIQKLFAEKGTDDKTFKERLVEIKSPKIVIEPGRSLVGNAQVTLVRVCHVGKTPNGHNITHVNAGVNHHSMNIVISEQLHRIEIANRIRGKERFETFVAGNLCYTGDLLYRIKATLSSIPRRGDYLIIYDTGAYSDFFVSNTNSFPRPARAMVTRGGVDRLLVRREEMRDVFQRDIDWIKSRSNPER